MAKTPGWLEGASLSVQGEYKKAIRILKNELKKTNPKDLSTLALAHINLSVCYFKTKDTESCNHHCAEALKVGHNTGLAAERLAINLEKAGRLEDAIDVCRLIISEDYTLHKNSRRNKDHFRKRLARLEKKAAKSNEPLPEPKFFSEEDKATILRNNIADPFRR